MPYLRKNSNTDTLIEFIQTELPYTVLLDQTAEECCELAQALLKKSRKLRDANPTPKSMLEIDHDIIEEFTDLMICVALIGLWEDTDIFEQKLKRWASRIKDAE